MDIYLHTITPEESDQFLSLAEAYFKELNPNFVPTPEWKKNYYSRLASSPAIFPKWIKNKEGVIIGFIISGLVDHLYLMKKIGVVYELYVAKAYRRSGVAETVARMTILDLKASGASKVQLEIVENNIGAQSFWKKIGFEKVSARYVLSCET